MVTGGNATVFVSNMDAAIDFYTGILGLKLTNRFGNEWATVQAGNSLVIGLHPASPKHPAPGTNGAMVLALEIDQPIEEVVNRLTGQGVRFKGSIIRDGPGNFITFFDPDGNEIYFWEVSHAMATSSEHAASHA